MGGVVKSIFGGGGGGGSAPAPSNQTVTQTNIPEYARPYVERMLGKSEAITDINQNPYQAYGGQRIADFNQNQLDAFADVFKQTPASQLGTATGLAERAGIGAIGMQDRANMLGNEAMGYGQAGSMYGSLGADQAMAAARGAQREAQMYGGMGAGFGSRGAQAAEQGFGAGEAFARQATDPNAMKAYMSPYMQNAVDYQKSQAIRDFDVGQQTQKARAVGAGAFGGSRQAIAEAEAQRNLSNQLAGIQATGTQKAFEDAQRQQQFGANLGLQGLQTGYGGLGLGIQGAQAGLQGVGQQLGAGQLGLQGATSGMQGAGYGLQGVQAATGAGQLGLQGLGAANTAAGTLGTLGQTQFGQEQAISGERQKVGAIQQGQAQQALDLDYQDFLKQRNYPYQQLGFFSDMLRGLPLSQSSQSMYTAPPSMASQLGGLGTTALGLYGMSGGFKANGGMVGKGYADGGLMAAQRYKNGGYAEGGDISMLNVKQLTEMLDNPTLTPMEVEMIQKRIMLLNRMGNNPTTAEIMSQGAGIGSIPTGDMVPEEGMAGGGIVAFAKGGKSEEDYQTFLENQVRKSIENQMGGNSFAKSEEEKARLEKAIAARQERSPYEALALAGLGTMAGTSQYGLTNLGLGATEGLKSYSRSKAADTADRQKMLEQQVIADRAEDARRSTLTGQMQGTLGQMYNKQAALEAAAATRAAAGASKEDRNITRAAALVGSDPTIKSLQKQLENSGYQPGSPEYNYYEQRIAERQNQIYKTVGVAVPEITPSNIAFPKPAEKPGFFDRLGKMLGGDKPAAALPMPKSKDDLVKNSVYNTARGPATWDGKQFVATGN